MAQPPSHREVATAAAVSRQFQPRAVYVAAALQALGAVWMLLEPGGLPLAVLACGLAALTIWLAKRHQARTILQIAVVLMVIGALFVFSGGLIVAALGVLLFGGWAADRLIASRPQRPPRSS